MEIFKVFNPETGEEAVAYVPPKIPDELSDVILKFDERARRPAFTLVETLYDSSDAGNWDLESLIWVANAVSRIYSAVPEKGDALVESGYCLSLLDAKAREAYFSRFSGCLTNGINKSELNNFVDAVLNLVLGVRAGLDSEYAVDFANNATDGKLREAGKVFANFYRLKEDNADLFGRIYEIACEKHGLFNATLGFACPYIASLRVATNRFNVEELTLTGLANFVDPCVEIFQDGMVRIDNLDNLAYHALGAQLSGMTNCPDQAWWYATALLEAASEKWNINRWSESVKRYVSNRLSLDGAVSLASSLEMHAKEKGQYCDNTVDRCVNLQQGMIFDNEEKLVNNAVSALYDYL